MAAIVLPQPPIVVADMLLVNLGEPQVDLTTTAVTVTAARFEAYRAAK